MRPLAGTTVVALEQAIAAPLATRHLADLGARIIKIERPQGGDFARDYDRRVAGLSSHFVWLNRSKESLALDVKTAPGRTILHRLVREHADILVQNLAPGAAARLGLDRETLARDKPSLIACNISGYGEDGPYRDRKAYDLLIQAEAGFLSVTGTPELACKAGSSIADIAAGMYAFAQILTALLEKSRTGSGRTLDISMLESLTEWMGHPLYYAYQGAAPPPRATATHATIFPYGPVRTQSGDIMLLAVQNEREWRAFCTDIIERPDLAADPTLATNAGRNAARNRLAPIIEAAVASLPTEILIARLEAARIAYAELRDMAALWSHPQLVARNRWREIDSPAGPLPALLPPGGWDEPPCMGAVPALGAHTDAILAELGCTADEIAAWRAAGAVA